MVENNFQNCSYRVDDVTDYVIFLKNNEKKWLKYAFFSKIILVVTRKKIFNICFKFLKVNIKIEYI